MKEFWKDVKGYEGLYQVSNLGNVKSYLTWRGKSERILSGRISGGGYLMVTLCKNKKHKNYKIHQLVAVAFLGHVINGITLVIDHINFVKTDNRASNLRIVTSRTNSNQKHIKSSSIYTGVSKRKNVFESRVKIKKKLIRLGTFDTEIEASEYYENALVCINENRANEIVIKRKYKPIKNKYIYWHKKAQKWMLTINKKYYGLFLSEQDAVNYRNKLLNNLQLVNNS